MKLVLLSLLATISVSIQAYVPQSVTAASIPPDEKLLKKREVPASMKLSFREKMKLRQQRNTENVVRTLFDENMSEFNADSILRRFDDLPAFNIFKDNYFVAGTDVFGKHNSNTSDAKFQISIGHRLTDSRLPFRTYLFLTYSQIAIWDVFKKSFPFRDINYNPGIGLGKALIYNNKVLGALLLQFEHE